MAPTKAVNRAVDPKERDANVNTKLRLYSIYKAFSNGKMPSNKQADVAFNSVINSKYLASPSKELSEEGQVLVKDLRDLLEQAKELFISKNEGDLLQEFIWDAQHIEPPDVRKLDGPPVDKDTAKQDTTKAAEGVKTLGTLLISNGEFRKLLRDSVVLFRDIGGDVALQAGEKIKPSEEELSQIDQPAEENVFHEKPDLSREQVMNQFKSQLEKYKIADPKDAQDAVNQATKAAMGDRQSAPPSEIDFRAGGKVLTSRIKETVSQNVPEETKNRFNESLRQTQEFFSNKMPPERREKLLFRLKKMIVEIQGHPEYRPAIETLLNLAEQYGGYSRNVSQKGAGLARCARLDPNLQNAMTNLRILIERFANSTSTDDFFEALNNIYRDAEQDPQLKGWFSHMNSYVRKCLAEQGYVMQDAATEEWNKLYDDGHYLLRERYRNHVDRVTDEIKFLASQFNEDPQNRAFGDSVAKFFKDLGLLASDERGMPKFKPHLIKDITSVFVPEIFENLRYIPLPRIEVSDKAIDAVVENIVIESDNMAPNVFEFGTDNYWRWGRKGINNRDDHKVMIAASGIQADIKDVSYYIKRKEGFPTITDTGVMDIFLGGEGFSFKIAASTPPSSKDKARFFKADRVTVIIKNLDIRLKKSRHKILFNIFKPMLFNIVRPALQKVLEKQIQDMFAKADAFAYKVNTKAQEALESVKADPRNAPKLYSAYSNAIRQTMMEKKQQAESIAQERQTKVQVATTHHDAMFKDIKLPGYVTNRATEFKELAEKGERWHSPVFDIGDASPSKDLPKVAPVTRKPHDTAQGGLRERPQGGQSQGANGHALTYGSQEPSDKAAGPDGFTKQIDQALGTTTTPGPVGAAAPVDVRIA